MMKKVQVIMLPHNNINTTITKYLPNTLSTNNDMLAPHTNQHLYFISDDEIKEDDWWLDLDRNRIWNDKSLSDIANNAPSCKKIIITTDKSLSPKLHKGEIVDSSYPKEFHNILPQPSQDFIDEYVKAYNNGKIITEVLVEYEKATYDKWFDNGGQPVFDTIKVNPKNTVNIKSAKNSWNREELIKAMIWAERNGKDYVGTDKEGQLKQFNEYIDKL